MFPRRLKVCRLVLQIDFVNYLINCYLWYNSSHCFFSVKSTIVEECEETYNRKPATTGFRHFWALHLLVVPGLSGRAEENPQTQKKARIRRAKFQVARRS